MMKLFCIKTENVSQFESWLLLLLLLFENTDGICQDFLRCENSCINNIANKDLL